MQTDSVGIIEPVGGHGGMNYYDYGLAQGLKQAGVCVSLYTSEGTIAPENADYTCNFFFRGIYGSTNKYIRGLRYARGLFASLFNARITKKRIIHYHFFKSGFIELNSLVLAKLFGFSVAVTVHDVESFDKADDNYFSKLVFYIPNGLIVHNQASFNELIKKHPNTILKTQIIPHGNYLLTNSEVADGLEFRERKCISKTAKVFLFFGQIKEVKGLEILIDAFAMVRKTRDDVVLIIAGKVWKDDFSKYSLLIESLGLRRFIVLDIRYIHDNEVAAFYAASDFVVLPYKRIYQSGVLLMAMSYSKPVIVSNLLGMTEIVEDNLTGFIFEANNAHSLAATMIRALNSNASIPFIVNNAMNKMRGKFSWGSIGKETANFYSRLM